ncbi:MAG: cytochrome c [Elusimicrobia bacterium]|nr:cytochrome c [Elusimicrobiota bacterium]
MRLDSLFLSAIVLSACTSASDPVSRGKSRFVGMGCLTCHRVGERGGGQAGPDLTTVGLRHSAQWLDQWMKNPKEWKPDTAMPTYNVGDDVRAELVAYMDTLKGKEYRDHPPWNSGKLKADPEKRGERIYSRTGCGACHGPRGKGGYPNNNVVGHQIPSLALVRDGFTREELKERIAQGRRPEPADPAQPPPLVVMPPWKDFLTEDEMEDLITYLFSLRPAEKPNEEWDQ